MNQADAPSHSPSSRAEPEVSGHGQAKEKLLHAAAELFAEKGFDQVTIREIAAKAGVRHGGVNYHFRGKQELYRAVLSRFGPRGNHITDGGNPLLHEALQVRGQAAAQEMLGRLVRQHLSVMAERSHPVAAGLLEQEMRRPEGPDDQVFENAVLLRHRAIEHLLQQIAPGLKDREQLRLFSMGVASRTAFFWIARPIAFRLLDLPAHGELSPERIDRIADHIVQTTLASLPQ